MMSNKPGGSGRGGPSGGGGGAGGAGGGAMGGSGFGGAGMGPRLDQNHSILNIFQKKCPED